MGGGGGERAEKENRTPDWLQEIKFRCPKRAAVLLASVTLVIAEERGPELSLPGEQLLCPGAGPGSVGAELYDLGDLFTKYKFTNTI